MVNFPALCVSFRTWIRVCVQAVRHTVGIFPARCLALRISVRIYISGGSEVLSVPFNLEGECAD